MRYFLLIIFSIQVYGQSSCLLAAKYLKTGRYQQAAWQFADNGKRKTSSELVKRLEADFASQKLSNPVRPTGEAQDETVFVEMGKYKGIYKPYYSHMPDRREVAAYKMDKMIGLDMVPVTVTSDLNGRKGSVQMIIEAEDYKSLNPAPTEPGKRSHALVFHPDNLSSEDQIIESGAQWEKDMRFFDFLIGNIDRHSENIMFMQDGRAMAIDHDFAFIDMALDIPDNVDYIRPRPEVLERFRGLTEQDFRSQLGSDLSAESMNRLLERRQMLLNAFSDQ